MRQVAGHSFDEWTDRCTGVVNGQPCNKHWLDIAHVDFSYENELGYAHVGALNAREIGEITLERERRRAVFEAAISGRQTFSLEEEKS